MQSDNVGHKAKRGHALLYVDWNLKEGFDKRRGKKTENRKDAEEEGGLKRKMWRDT